MSKRTPKEKVPIPPKLTPVMSANFNTLKRACLNGDLCLMSSIRKSDNQPIGLVCAVNRVEGGGFQFSPLAVLIEGNPYELFHDPTVSGGDDAAGS